MNLKTLVVSGLVFLSSFWLTGRLSTATRLRVIDRPNERSLHNTLIPRTGGLAIISSMALGWFLIGVLLVFVELRINVSRAQLLWIIGSASAVAAISLWNDLNELHPVIRLILHALGAAGVVVGVEATVNTITIPVIGHFGFGPLAVPLTVLLLVWMTNLYNFMDGMDGFAGGMTVIGFGFLAYLSRDSSPVILLLALLTVAAAAGFLFHNKPPAKIFMGDAGSITLGFLAGTLSVIGIYQGVFDFCVPVLIFSPFIVDATATLLRRLFKGKRIWQAHREHYYQRLVLAGWSHRRTVLAEYGLMISCGLSAIAYSRAGEWLRFVIILSWVLIYIALMFGVRHVERKSNGKLRNIRGIVIGTAQSGDNLQLEP